MPRGMRTGGGDANDGVGIGKVTGGRVQPPNFGQGAGVVQAEPVEHRPRAMPGGAGHRHAAGLPEPVHCAFRCLRVAVEQFEQ